MSSTIFFLIGEDEYHSDRTMPPFAEKAARELGCKAIVQVAGEQEPMDLAPLDRADLLVIFVRFRNPTDAQLRQLDAWFSAGRPVLGMRTASHGFSNARGWFPDYFGGHYMRHAPNSDGTLAVIDPAASAHPVVAGLPHATDMGYGGTYNTSPLADTAQPLMIGKTGELPAEPVTWVNRYTPDSRVLYTALGSEENFAVPALERLLLNSIEWCLGSGQRGEGLQSVPAGWEEPGYPDPPALAAPSGASVLFDRAPLADWTHWDLSMQAAGMRLDGRAETSSGGQKFTAARWSSAGRVLTAAPGRGDIVSRARFARHRLHLSFLLPEEPVWLPAKFRGTSGVFLGGQYEIELRAAADGTAPEHRCGALNGVKPPDAEVTPEVGQWHELEAEYTPSAGGARLSVWLDGQRLHDDVAVNEPTSGGFLDAPPEWGDMRPVRLQADASPVRFANMWVTT